MAHRRLRHPRVARRADRDIFRDRLLGLGAASIQNGMYVSPHRWDAEVREEFDRLDIAEHVTLATTDDLEIGGDHDPRHIAASLWPLDDIAARYRDVHRDLPRRAREPRRR